MSDVIDADGFRPNVGIVLLNARAEVFWARRVARDGWQFPQGGIGSDETPLEAMYRELAEETGLLPQHVEVLGCTRGWLRYRLPSRYLRHGQKPLCIGQKQVWFLLRFVGEDTHIRVDASGHPEFDSWRWVEYWYPGQAVVAFKREVYQRALRQLVAHAEALCGRELPHPPLPGAGSALPA